MWTRRVLRWLGFFCFSSAFSCSFLLLRLLFSSRICILFDDWHVFFFSFLLALFRCIYHRQQTATIISRKTSKSHSQKQKCTNLKSHFEWSPWQRHQIRMIFKKEQHHHIPFHNNYHHHFSFSSFLSLILFLLFLWWLLILFFFFFSVVVDSSLKRQKQNWSVNRWCSQLWSSWTKILKWSKKMSDWGK